MKRWGLRKSAVVVAVSVPLAFLGNHLSSMLEALGWAAPLEEVGVLGVVHVLLSWVSPEAVIAFAFAFPHFWQELKDWRAGRRVPEK